MIVSQPYTHIESYTGQQFSGIYYPLWSEETSTPTYGTRAKPKGWDRVFNPTNWGRTRLVRVDGFDEVTRIFTIQHPYTGEVTKHPATVTLAKDARCGLAYASAIPSGLALDPTPILVKIAEQGVNLGVTLAEYRQTSDMFVAFAGSLVRTYRDVRGLAKSPSKQRLKRLSKLFSGDLMKLAKKAPENWLMYRYGIMPTISDICGSIDAMVLAATAKPLVRRYSCKIPLGAASREAPIVDPWYQPIGTQFHSGVAFAIMTAYVEWAADRPSVDFWKVSGLGNPLNTVWELIPFSFVVDWAIGVGDYLTSIDALAGSKRCAITSANHMDCYSAGPQGYSEYKVYMRYVLDATPPSPTWNPSLNWKRCVDSVALLRSFR